MRGTLIGRHATYGSSCSLRLSLSALAAGSSGSSPGFSPPSRSMSAFEPPPSHGPLRSGCPSGRRGTGPLTSLSARSGVPPAGMLETRCCASVCQESNNVRVATVAETTRILFTTALPRILNRLSLFLFAVQLVPARDACLVVLGADVLHQLDILTHASGNELQLDGPRVRSGVLDREVIDERAVVR